MSRSNRFQESYGQISMAHVLAQGTMRSSSITPLVFDLSLQLLRTLGADEQEPNDRPTGASPILAQSVPLCLGKALVA